MTNADFDDRRERRDPLKAAGGGGTSGPMDPRIDALEKAFLRMEVKLDAIATDVAFLKGKVEGMPTAIAFGELKGRVDSLPTTGKMAAIVSIAGGIVTLILKWPDIIALLHR